MKGRLLALACACAVTLVAPTLAFADTIGVSSSINTSTTTGTLSSSQTQHEDYNGITTDLQFAGSGLQYNALKADNSGTSNTSGYNTSLSPYCYYYCYGYQTVYLPYASNTDYTARTDSTSLVSNAPQFSFASSNTVTNFFGRKDSSQTFAGVQNSSNTTTTQTSFSNF